MDSSDGRSMNGPVAYVYGRVSSEEQARTGFSLQTQRASCHRYVEVHGWHVGKEYQDIMTGTRDDRLAYQQMLSDARRARLSGQEVVMVVAALDRLGRRLMERVRSREELKALGIPLHSVREGGEVSDLIANILAAVAQEEARQASERVRTVKRELIANGWHPGGTPPWGYRWRPATAAERAAGAPRSVFETDPAAAPYVTDLFRRVADRESRRDSFRWVASLPPEARGGFALAYSNLRKRLLSPVYIARPREGDRDVLLRPVGRWPALTDDVTWDRVRQRGAEPIRRATGQFLLSGFMTCSRCGALMAGRWWRDHQTAEYACGHRACRTYFGRAAPLDTAVLGAMRDLIMAVTSTAPAAQASFERAWTRLLLPAYSQDEQDERNILERAVDRACHRLVHASLLLVDGDLDAIGYERVRERVEADLADARVGLAALSSPGRGPVLPTIEALRRQATEWDAALRGHDIPAQRSVLTVLVDHVEAVRVGRGDYEVAVTWTPLGDAIQAASQAGTPIVPAAPTEVKQ